MARPVGLEPTTPGLEIPCSNPAELWARAERRYYTPYFRDFNLIIDARFGSPECV